MEQKSSSLRVITLVLVVIAYLALGITYALYTPLWQAPDEPAHFNYIKYVAEERHLPVMGMGDYPLEYLEEIKARRFPLDMSVESMRYESWQPPLYYSLGAAIYWATCSWPLASQVVALRFFSLLLGLGVVLLAYRLVREMFPESDLLALGTAAFVAVVPMHVAMTAAINNDGLAELIISSILLGCVKLLKRGLSARRLITLGVLAGLGLLAKNTTVVSAALIVASLWMAMRRDLGGNSSKGWARALALVFLPALLVSGGWFLRNALVYGFDDPLIWKRHAQVVQGQLTTAQYLMGHSWQGWLGDFLRTTFRSFWAQFGWMAVPVDRRIYLLLWLLCGLAGLGVLLFIIRQWRGWRIEHEPLDMLSPRRLSFVQLQELALLCLSTGLTLASYLWYNRQFVQFQGRYLFPAIVPLGVGFTLGLSEVLSRGYEGWLAALFGGGMVLAVGKGSVTGNLDKPVIALLAAGWVGCLIKRALPSRFAKVFMILIYADLAALTAASPFLFIVPHLSPSS